MEAEERPPATAEGGEAPGGSGEPGESSLRIIDGPPTRERALFHLAAFASLLAVPVVWTAALFWWPGDPSRPPSEAMYRRKWLRLAVLLGAFDMVLTGLLGMRQRLDDSFSLTGTREAAGGPILGVSAVELGGHLVVEKVLPGTAAAEAGLEPGDEIAAIDGKNVPTLAALRRVLEEAAAPLEPAPEAGGASGDGERAASAGGEGEKEEPRPRIEVSYFRKGEVRRGEGALVEPEYLKAHRGGVEALQRGEIAAAGDGFRKALETYPGPGRHAASLRGLAWVESRQGNLSASGALLEEAIPLAPPSQQDSLRVERVGLALRAGEPAAAARWSSEVEDEELRRAVLPAVLSAEGRTGDAWRTWGAGLGDEPALVASAVFLAFLVLLSFRRRSLAEGLRLLAAAIAVLLGSVATGILAGALWGAAVHGNAFTSQMASIYPEAVAITNASQFLALLGLTVAAHRWLRGEGGPRLGWRLDGTRGIPLAVLGGVALLYGLSTRVSLLALAILGSGPDPHPLLELPELDSRLGAYLFPSVCLLAPLAEEVFFRGFLHVHLRARLGPLAAVAGTAILFGLLHPVSPIYVVGATGLGLVLGYLRERSGGLIVPILAHAAFNTINWSLSLMR